MTPDERGYTDIPAEPQHANKFLGECTNKELLKIASEANNARDIDNTGDAPQRYLNWLVYAQRDGFHQKMWWLWAQERGKQLQSHLTPNPQPITPETIPPERNSYILNLWNRIDQQTTWSKMIQCHIADRGSVTFYRRHFFEWFLRRYNIPYAMRVYCNDIAFSLLSVPLCLLSVALVIIYFAFLPGKVPLFNWLWWSILAGLTLNYYMWYVIAKDCCDRIPFFQTLTPRLAVTTAAGYLFLFSAGGLVETIYTRADPWYIALPVTTAVLSCILFYIGITIRRRVWPPPYGEKLAGKCLHLLLYGITYSLLELFMIAPLLFQPPFLNSGDPQSKAYLLVTATLALAIGMVLQLVWEEKPVTELL